MRRGSFQLAAPLTDENGKTRLTLNARVVKALPVAADALAGMDPGWTESLERLAALVAG
ncbi:MAG TPA: SRPBCC domain-containing protein [Thermoanaerobaculia bacterium]|nr:SRPBCC domain-containing protein [Thermoanaerobaculia bacterium]